MVGIWDTCGRGPAKTVTVVLVAVLFGFPNMGRRTEKKPVSPLVTVQKTADLPLGSRSSKPSCPCRTLSRLRKPISSRNI